MSKESCNCLGHRFQSHKCFFDRQTEIELVGNGVLGDVGLDVLPDLFVGVELGRVRWQVDDFEATLGGLDVGLDGLGLVDAVTVNDENDGLRRLQHELLQELQEHVSVDQTFVRHELHGALNANGRDHLYRGTGTGGAHDRGFPRQAPSGAAVVVAAHTGLVCEEHACTRELGPLQDGGEFLGFPLGNQSAVLFLGAVQRPLRAEAQVVHDFADGWKTELDLELALNELGDEAQRPQAKVEAELVGSVCLHQKGQALQLLPVELGRTTGYLPGDQAVLTVFEEVRRPLQHRTRRDLKQGGNLRCRLPLTVHFHRLHADPFLFLAAAGEHRAGV
jgi:hypothetical protein